MPAGGGSHGGGGGGYYGGYHHHGGGDSDCGNDPNWKRYKRSPLAWTITSVLVVVVTIPSIMLIVRYAGTDYGYDNGLQYSPTDTRIIPVPKALCQGLTLAVNDAYGPYSAQLYMLDSPPTLTGSESFSFSAEAVVGGPDEYEFKFYYFYMYPGSNLTVTACITDTNSGQSIFYLIKGNNNYNRWQEDTRSAPSEIKFTVSDNCQLSSNVTHSFNVTDEDYYYLIFDHDSSMSTSIQTHMTFYRTLYELPSNGSISDSCSIDTGSSNSCSLSVPLSGNETYFLTVTPYMSDSDDIDWIDGVGLHTSCSPRIWMFVVISLCCVLGLTIIIMPLLVYAAIHLNNKKKTVDLTTESKV